MVVGEKWLTTERHNNDNSDGDDSIDDNKSNNDDDEDNNDKATTKIQTIIFNTLEIEKEEETAWHSTKGRKLLIDLSRTAPSFRHIY